MSSVAKALKIYKLFRQKFYLNNMFILNDFAIISIYSVLSFESKIDVYFI